MRITVSTWNVGRSASSDHFNVLSDLRPDVVALQEVSAGGVAFYRHGLARLGLDHFHAMKSDRFPFVLVLASRWPMDVSGEALAVPFAERVQLVRVKELELEILNVHVPAASSSGVAAKVGTYVGLSEYLARPSAYRRILCGDFNTPKAESTDGRLDFWGDVRQREAENSLLGRAVTHGLRDSFRALHGYSRTAYSWSANNGVGRRYDHILASEDLPVLEADYLPLEEIRSRGLSDHAPLRVVLELTSTPPARPASAPTAEITVAPEVPGSEAKADAAPAQRGMSVTRSKRASGGPAKEELVEFLAGLQYRVDDRKHPDNMRYGQFCRGWKRAIAEKHMQEDVLRRALTWNNLGYRAGMRFGNVSNVVIDAVYRELSAIYLEGVGKDPVP